MTIERPFLFASFKMISSKSDFIHIFNDFIHVYSPWEKAKQNLGDKLLMSTQTPYHFDHLLQVSNKSLWILTVYIFFFFFFFDVFPHVYSPGAGADNPLWTNFWLQEKCLVILSICCTSFKKYIWSLILYIFLSVFIHAYKLGAGADKSLGSEFLFWHKSFVTLVICYKFLPLYDFLTVFPHIKA